MERKTNVKKVVVITITSVVVVMALIVLFNSFGTIDAGEMGVKTRFGKVVDQFDTGLYFRIVFIDNVTKIDVQTQKEQTNASAASSDLQVVTAEVAINYNIDPSKVSDLYIRIGTDYKTKIIDPAIQEVVKSVTAKYTAEQLITKRAEVTDLIQSQLSQRLGSSDIEVSSVSITNFDFSKSFNEAIENKVTAEQNALAAKNKLDQVKFEAEQTIASAQAEAEAIKIKTEAVNSQGGKDYVQLQFAEKWDGHLPTTMVPGAALPLINIK